MSSLVPPLVSLIVPVWGDDDLAAELVESLRIDPTLGEWVISAVQPGERLRNLDRCGALRLVVCEEPSRGAQMNQGAAQARGSVLCFHHADTEFRQEHLRALVEAAKDESIVGGAYHRRFDDRRFWMIAWEEAIKRIIPVTGPLFGDQSIFVRAGIFREMGGFANIPLMEDLDFSGRLRRSGRISVLEPPLWSSPRRFRRIGNWRATLLNAGFIVLFYLGVSPRRLHRWYYRDRVVHRIA